MAELGEDVRALLEAPNFAHLATVQPDGSPHSVPVWVRLEGDRIAFFTQPGSRKAQNLARDPRVALSLTDLENPYLSAWARGQVVKLFKAGVPQRLSRHEARVTSAVFAAGAPAPEVLDEVTVEGRFGIVLSRFDGPTLMQLSRSGAMSPAQTGAILASLYISVHKTQMPP